MRSDAKKDYRWGYDKFGRWGEKSRLEIDPASVLDDTLLLLAHENLFEDETADEGSKLLAAMMYCTYASSTDARRLTLNVQNRGRLETVTSVKRDKKGGRINQVLALPHEGMQQRAHLCASKFRKHWGMETGTDDDGVRNWSSVCVVASVAW